MPDPAVRLSDFTLELTCPACTTRQVIADPLDPGFEGLIASDEHLQLTAHPGRYDLVYRLRCWTCGHLIDGRLRIASRAAATRQITRPGADHAHS